MYNHILNKKVLILDDHTLFLKGMALILLNNCIECSVNTYQTINNLKKDNLNFEDYDLLISDIELPNENSFELFALLKEQHPELPILVVSMHKKNAIIRRCKSLGVKGYLLKDEYSELVKAIITIIEGGEYYSSSILKLCKKTKNTFIKLTKREEQIIKLIAKGYNNYNIAKKLFLSPETIKTHKRNIKIKLNLNSKAGIIGYANENYLI